MAWKLSTVNNIIIRSLKHQINTLLAKTLKKMGSKKKHKHKSDRKERYEGKIYTPKTFFVII